MKQDIYFKLGSIFSLIFKLGFIFTLIFGLMLPQSFMLGLVGERKAWRQQAYQSIEQSWPGKQTIAGPVLAIPYHLTYNTKERIIGSDDERADINKEVDVDGILYIIPKQLNIDSKLESSLRYRGIYGVPVYSSLVQFKGEFSTQPLLDLINRNKESKIHFKNPLLSVLVGDQRGIAAPPSLLWNGAKLSFQPVSLLPGTEAGMHVYVPDIVQMQDTRIAFSFEMELRGLRSVNFALLSENTDLQLTANWPHPSFTGELLPEKRDINMNGFTAQWRASAFSYNVSNILEGCRKGRCLSLLEHAVGIDLIQPVDSYQKSERSIKYAELFIILTFVALILFDLLKKIRVHPIQYTLVGMALLVFYLLLISLSEHIEFLLAYVIGASCSTALLTFYFGAILRSRRLGLTLGAGLSALYVSLYVILQAEESALLMGSLLLFIVLATLMLATRHFDWYALTNQVNTVSEVQK